MVNYALEGLFLTNSDKQWRFESDNYILTNNDFVIESLELRESMCETNEFKIGTYSSSRLKIKVLKTGQNERFVNERFSISVVLDNNTANPFNFCDFTVYSDKITSDHRSRELIMYDDLFKFSSIDVHDWYNNFVTDGNPVTIKQLRDGFFEELENYDIHIEQEDTTLVNDSQLVYRTTTLNTMLASDLLKCILHYNACNGIINREGKFRYIYIPQNGASSDLIVPSLQYYNCDFEEYEVKSFRAFNISETSSRSGYGKGYPERGSMLTLSGNFLWYKARTNMLKPILDNIADRLENSLNFTPFNMKRKGNPCVECGDVVRVTTDLRTFQSFIVSRTLTGLQGLIDTYVTESDEYISNDDDLGNIQDTTIGYIGDSAIAEDEGGESYIDQANCAWKLRSYPVDEETDERYYTYLTKNKHFTVSNSETEGHNAENDRSYDCTIGSKNYPWKAGYFNELHVGSGDNSRTVQEQFIAMIRNIGFRLLQEPSEVSVVYDPLPKVVRIKWEDPPDLDTNRPVPAIWAGTVVIRGESADMLHRWDGELIAETTVRNQYSLEELIDDTIEFEEGKIYYYGIFPYDDNGCYRFTKVVPVKIVPMPIPDVSSLSAQNTDITVTWHVPTEYEWESIKLVYKKGSVPQNDSDGTVITITESGGTILQNLSEYSTYYFKVFSVEESTYFEFESEEQHIATGAFGRYRAFMDSVTVTRSGGDTVDDEVIVTQIT